MISTLGEATVITVAHGGTIVSFDVMVFNLINGFAGHSAALDHLFKHIEANTLFTGNLFLAMLWYQYFRSDNPECRELVVKGILGVIVTIFVARGISLLLPYRARPLLTEHMHQLAIPADYHYDQWSSLPSDTTAFYAALALAVWFLSRRLGVLLLLFTLVYITIPRIYLGLHWPSDLAAGWLVAFVVMPVFMRSETVSNRLSAPLQAWGDRHPGWFYGLAFYLTCEMSAMFINARGMFHGLHEVLEKQLKEFEVTMPMIGALMAVIVVLLAVTFVLVRRRHARMA